MGARTHTATSQSGVCTASRPAHGTLKGLPTIPWHTVRLRVCLPYRGMRRAFVCLFYFPSLHVRDCTQRLTTPCELLALAVGTMCRGTDTGDAKARSAYQRHCALPSYQSYPINLPIVLYHPINRTHDPLVVAQTTEARPFSSSDRVPFNPLDACGL